MKGLVTFLTARGMDTAALDEARLLLRSVEARFGELFTVATVDAGDSPWSADVIAACRQSDAIWVGELADREPALRRQLQWRLRRELGVPAKVRPLRRAGGTRSERSRSMDVLVVSEEGDVEAAEAQEAKVREVTQVAAGLAQRRWGLVTVVAPPPGVPHHEAWAAPVRTVLARVQSIRWDEAPFEEASRRMSAAPGSLDVMLAESRVADALCEAAAGIAGGAPATGPNLAGFLGEGRGVYLLGAGSAATGILNVAMGLRCSLRLEREATAVEGALAVAIISGVASGSAGDGAALWEAVRSNLLADLTTSLAI